MCLTAGYDRGMADALCDFVCMCLGDCVTVLVCVCWLACIIEP